MENVAIIEARGLKKTYGERTVLDVGRLAVERGKVLVVLGPSGAGKSVLLRLLNLLEPPTDGRVFFEGAEAQGLTGSHRLALTRRMAMIFQDPLLFRGTVAENIAYGLKIRRVPAGERSRRVAAAIESVGLSGLEGKDVKTLSGGEAQRTSLARALVLEPDVLLLDEPFASVDRPSRRRLQEDTGRLFASLGISALFVTHDQEEAARMGHRIVVMSHGEVLQEGEPREVFYEPANEYVARFMGVDNIFSGRVSRVDGGLATIGFDGSTIEATTDFSEGTQVSIGVRPEDVTLFAEDVAGQGASSRNFFTGTVRSIELSGPVARVTLECPFPLVATITRRSVEELGLREGARAGARFKATAVHVMEGAGMESDGLKGESGVTGS